MLPIHTLTYVHDSIAWLTFPGVLGADMLRHVCRSDPTFHNWSMVDDKFYPIRGGGGGMFFPLPKQVAVDADVDAGDRADGANATAPIYTHMMQEDFRGFGDGEPRFVRTVQL